MTETNPNQDAAASLSTAGDRDAASGTRAGPSPADAPGGLVARTRNILLSPAAEWQRIARETTTIGGIYRRHVVPLAALPAIAGVVVVHWMFSAQDPFFIAWVNRGLSPGTRATEVARFSRKAFDASSTTTCCW